MASGDGTTNIRMKPKEAEMNDQPEPLAPWEQWILGGISIDPKDVHIVYSGGMSGAAVYYKGEKVFANDTDEAYEHILDTLGVKVTHDVPLTLPGESGWHEVPLHLDVLLARKTD